MGEVYLAEDTKLKREVAIKFLPEDLRHDPERLRRFRTEAEAAAKLNHPNIATIHSIEEDEAALFYVEENRLMRVPVTTGSVFQADKPEPRFTAEEADVFLSSVSGTFDAPPYDVHPDGDRLVMIAAAEEAVLVVVENWSAELEGGPSN